MEKHYYTFTVLIKWNPDYIGFTVNKKDKKKANRKYKYCTLIWIFINYECVLYNKHTKAIDTTYKNSASRQHQTFSCKVTLQTN